MRIGVVVETAFRGVFEGNPDIEDLLSRKPERCARWRPDLTLNLHGGSRSASAYGSLRSEMARGLRAFP